MSWITSELFPTPGAPIIRQLISVPPRRRGDALRDGAGHLKRGYCEEKYPNMRNHIFSGTLPVSEILSLSKIGGEEEEDEEEEEEAEEGDAVSRSNSSPKCCCTSGFHKEL